MDPLGHTVVAERPQQAGRGDVEQVAGDWRLLLALVAEAIGERVRDALCEQVAHPVGRNRVEVEAGRVSAALMPNGASRLSDATISGRIAASSAAIIPPSDAPTTGHGSAPVARPRPRPRTR